jgi:hypothetical protein
MRKFNKELTREYKKFYTTTVGKTSVIPCVKILNKYYDS